MLVEVIKAALVAFATAAGTAAFEAVKATGIGQDTEIE
jgi:hypothetical protein